MKYLCVAREFIDLKVADMIYLYADGSSLMRAYADQFGERPRRNCDAIGFYAIDGPRSGIPLHNTLILVEAEIAQMDYLRVA